jgi:phospholipid transport system transporter-binding protein
MNKSELHLTDDHLLQVIGHLNFNTVNKLWEESQPLLEKIFEIEIDLSGTEHSDSAGLALLMEWYRYAKQHKKPIIFRNVPQQLMNIAKTSGIHEILPMDS